MATSGKKTPASGKAASAKKRGADVIRLPVQPSGNARKDAIDKLVADAEKLYGPGCVQRAERTYASYTLRRPTGILSVDMAMAGGWPAAAPSVLVGPDGAGKDYLLWRTAAEAQRIYGKDFTMACYFTEFKPDKLYMRNYCGFQIALSETELEDLDRARHQMGQPGLTPEDLDHYRTQIGNFVAIYGLSADHGFDEVFKCVDSNLFQIVAVNSVGSMQTEAKEKTDSFEEFAQQRNEAMLLSKAMPKFSMYLNRRDQFDGPNETTLLLVNQVRSADGAKKGMPGRPVQDKDTYKTASNAWALKHHKAIELFLHNGARILDLEVKPPMVLGRKKQWELTKGKLGTHEGIKGEFDYFFGEGADIAGDILSVAVLSGVIDLSGSYYAFDDGGFKMGVRGAPKAADMLRTNGDFADYIRKCCYQAQGLSCRHR